MSVGKNDIHFETTYVVRVNKRIRLLKAFLLFALLLLLPLISYLVTDWYLGKQERILLQKTSEQEAMITSLNADLMSLKQLLANAELSADVDQSSIEQMRVSMVSSQEQIELLGEQIRFYQSLMDPNPETGGVYLESFEVEPALEMGEFQYSLVVAQRSSNHQRVSGRVELQLISEEIEGIGRTLSFAELTENAQALPLGFKFFQRVEGSLTLPDDFRPAKVRVLVRMGGESTPSIDETYEWSS